MCYTLLCFILLLSSSFASTKEGLHLVNPNLQVIIDLLDAANSGRSPKASNSPHYRRVVKTLEALKEKEISTGSNAVNKASPKPFFAKRDLLSSSSSILDEDLVDYVCQESVALNDDVSDGRSSVLSFICGENDASKIPLVRAFSINSANGFIKLEETSDDDNEYTNIDGVDCQLYSNTVAALTKVASVKVPDTCRRSQTLDTYELLKSPVSVADAIAFNIGMPEKTKRGLSLETFLHRNNKLSVANVPGKIRCESSIETFLPLSSLDNKENKPKASYDPNVAFKNTPTKKGNVIKKRIAVIGAGLEGTTLGLQFNNLSKTENQFNKDIRVISHTTLFTDDEHPMDGASKTGFLVHGKGSEYSTDALSALCCRLGGGHLAETYPTLFPPEQDPSVIFAVNENSDKPLYEETQKATRRLSKNMYYEVRDTPDIKRNLSKSQDELKKEMTEEVNSPKIKSAFISFKDRPMNVLKRDILLKREIEKAENITLQTNYKVHAVTSHKDKNNNFYYKIIRMIDGKQEVYDNNFDYVIIAAWCGTQLILENSAKLADNENYSYEKRISNSHPVVAKPRVMALCKGDMRNRKTIMTMPDGNMFHPVTDKFGVVYSAKLRGAYPPEGVSLTPAMAIEQGKNSLNNLKENFKKENESQKGTFDDVTHIGSAIINIVIDENTPLEIRHYKRPFKTEDGKTIAIPKKATQATMMATDVINMYFQDILKDNINNPCGKKLCDYARRGIEETGRIMNEDGLYNGKKFPDFLKILLDDNVSEVEMSNEFILLMKHFILTPEGKESYRAEELRMAGLKEHVKQPGC